MSNTYEHLQAGDEIGLFRSNGYGGDVRVVKVLRRTQTRVIVGPLYDGGPSYEFRAKDGGRVGPGHYFAGRRDWMLSPLADVQKRLADDAAAARVRSEISAAMALMNDYWIGKDCNLQSWLQNPETRAKAIAKLRATADALEQIK